MANIERYTPGEIYGTTPEEIVQSLEGELNRVSGLFNALADRIEQTSIVPDKFENGDIKYADGVDWNPGDGEGLYLRQGAVWDKLLVDSQMGIAINDIVQLEDVGGSAGLPAVDGSQLTGILPTGLGPLPWPTNTAPTGWLLCYGQGLNTTTYADLFAVIGYTYGGSGSTFNLPDLRGRVPLGKDNMGGTSANRVTATQADNLGQASGAEKHSLSIAELASHNHQQRKNSAGSLVAGNAQNTNWTTTPISNSTTPTTGNTGSGTAHNNTQPYQTFNYIIKT